MEYGKNSYGSQSNARMRVIFYGEPKDEDQAPKSIPDKESLEGRYVTVKEFANLNKIRGPELVDWGTYINNGGLIYPLDFFTECFTKPKQPDYTMKHIKNCNNNKKFIQSDSK